VPKHIYYLKALQKLKKALLRACACLGIGDLAPNGIVGAYRRSAQKSVHKREREKGKTGFGAFQRKSQYTVPV
jgi:hypothetical protein